MTNEMIERYLYEQGLKFVDKSLRDWIMVAWESEVHKNVFEMENVYRLASENIEASLGKLWETVRTELEGMEG